MTIEWLDLDEARNNLTDQDYVHLADSGSLTRRIRTRCPDDFEVQLIRHSTVKPEAQERAILNLPEHSEAISRQVFLCCRQQVKIFARTIIGLIPANRVLTERITTLGGHSLGSILFRDPLAKKVDMHLASISGKDIFFVDANLSVLQQRQQIWVRRNLYEYEGCDLLVYEAYIDFPVAELSLS